ncbi:MAG TPA: hypothetical protein VGM16_04255 [Gammaproteobacteria bacterium]|jgi:hypothetical protein
MDPWRYVLALAVASAATSFSDWYFMGVLFHDKYLAYPEVWRHQGNKRGESLAVAWSTLTGVLSAGVFLWLAVRLGVAADNQVFLLAGGLWLAAPVPLLLTQGAFIKIHFLNTVAALLGWLVRFALFAITARLILR